MTCFFYEFKEYSFEKFPPFPSHIKHKHTLRTILQFLCTLSLDYLDSIGIINFYITLAHPQKYEYRKPNFTELFRNKVGDFGKDFRLFLLIFFCKSQEVAK